MSTRQHKRLISTAAVIVACAAIATVLLGVAVPPQVTAEMLQVEPVTSPAVDANEPSIDKSLANKNRPDRERLRQLASIQLRQRLFDPPPPPPPPPPQANVAQPAPPPPSSLKIRLVGTAVEEGKSVALLHMPDGTINVCLLNESLKYEEQQVTVTHVDSRNVKLEYAGRTHELKLPPRE